MFADMVEHILKLFDETNIPDLDKYEQDALHAKDSHIFRYDYTV